MVTDSFSKMIEEMENGVFDLTQNGKCSGCGECCSNLIPVSQKEIKEIGRYIHENGIQECKHASNFLMEQPEIDLLCPFLDTNKEKDKCTIYEVRPEICRAFQCNIPPSVARKNNPDFQKTHFTVDMRAVFFNAESLFKKLGIAE